MPKQTNKEKALIALLHAPSVVEAAKQSGLSEETFYRYLKDKEFLAEYRAARRRTVEAAITRMQQLTDEAVETLQRNLHCENPSVEVRAAQTILDNAVKSVETMDILERLEVIENEFENQNKKN